MKDFCIYFEKVNLLNPLALAQAATGKVVDGISTAKDVVSDKVQDGIGVIADGVNKIAGKGKEKEEVDLDPLKFRLELSKKKYHK